MSATTAARPSQSLGVELRLETTSPSRRLREPVTCGLPCPRGWLHDATRILLEDGDGRPTAVQARALDRWSDGSIRWLLLDWQATVDETTSYRLRGAAVPEAPRPAAGVAVTPIQNGVIVETGRARFEMVCGKRCPFASVRLTEGTRPTTEFSVTDLRGHRYEPLIRTVHVEEAGPLRARVRLDGVLRRAGGRRTLAEFFAYLDFFAGSATVRISLTIRNPRRAHHPGGLWDLGNGGSIFLRDAVLRVALPEQPADCPIIRCSAEVGAPLADCPAPLELYQDSSGGVNWRSSNHLNHRRRVPHQFRGYRLRSGSTERFGLRATPIVGLQAGPVELAVAVPYFWQNFPKAVEASDRALSLSLFPRQSADGHELQGGEQKTHDFFVAFAKDEVTVEPLAWCRAPLLPSAAPEWNCRAFGSYLVPSAQDPNADYQRLVDAAIDGEDTFVHKREVVDEYGWRHFGDIYGDHEGVFHHGATPLVSHYNNQYDPVAGFGYQFLRSGDRRWSEAMRELAAHVIDIDIYHCGRDKTAYNRGLFWHTFHYVDADTGTHRSYPKAGKVCGGGPSCEHNYTTGLMLLYFMTGDPRARQTVIDLAQWVIDIDDGRTTIFRWLDRGPTGLASSSGNPLYHGPGRGAGNSVNALLDGHRLTGDSRFLAKAEELIRRCIHPADDIARRELLDAERRWYYTVFLQALGKYLDTKAERGDLDFMYAYGRAALLHYARWMAEHEYPYLDKPEILEYPTETWPAQDMRKSEVFKYAAKHASGTERERFLERSEFFFRYVTRTLAGMKTRTLCRPVVLLLSYGLMHGYFQQRPEAAAPAPPAASYNWGVPEVFVPQKARAKRRFRVLAMGSAVAFLAGAAALLLALCR